MRIEFVALIVVALLALLAWGIYKWLAPRPGPSPFKDFKTQLIEAGGWTFRYHQFGKGPHLVLLHGLGANLFTWRWIIPFLGKHFTVTAFDLPGFGASSKPLDATYGLDEQVERIENFTRRMGIDKMFLVGNSMGGNIALWYALSHPDQVPGLALIAPASSTSLLRIPLSRLAFLAGPASLVLTRAAMRWAHGNSVTKRHLVEPDRVEETFRTYGRKADAVRSFILATDVIRDRRLGERLADLAPPVLLLYGSRDKVVPHKVIDELETALRAVERHVHIGGGHHLQEDEPEWVTEKLVSFFLSQPD